MKYEKPFKTFSEQADLIIERGMIGDKDILVQCLKDVGYYRLSGYWRIFKRPNSEEFWPGTDFNRIWQLYTFDRKFRLIVFDSIERIEVYIRTQLVYLLAAKTGPFGFENIDTLPRMKPYDYKRFMNRCEVAYSRSREQFAVHFKSIYGNNHKLPPYWMLANLMDSGMVLNLYKGAPVDIRQKIAEELEIQTRVLDSWLVTINTVRNICAHHGRLWNKVIGTPPAIPKSEIWHEPFEIQGRKIFGTLSVLSYLLKYIAPDTTWHTELISILKTVSKSDRHRMGFDDGWKNSPIWSQWLL